MCNNFQDTAKNRNVSCLAFAVNPCTATFRVPEKVTHTRFDDDAQALKTLKGYCPELFNDDDEVPQVCCHKKELQKLKKTVRLISMMVPGCPACTDHFKQLLCHMTCAPNQRKFIQMVKKSGNGDGKEMVSEINYFIDEQFAKRAFEVCKDVTSMGTKLKNLICRPYDEDTCDHTKLLQFLGNDRTRRGYSPFQINYMFNVSEPFETADLTSVECDVSDASSKACACTDIF
ncbi:NPC intracellular sterol transporter 1-related protein 1 [Halotydeus destructor]|nr:NPC intracellular sterol transporter 1-related protein 1 [Halotydeus destructor]